MNGLDLLAISAAPILIALVILPIVIKRVRQHEQVLSDRVDQLGNLLQEQLANQHTEPNQESQRSVTEHILKVLRESESHPETCGNIHLASHVSSIHPLQNSLAGLSKRLADLDANQDNQNVSQILNLTSLTVAYIRSHLSEVIRVQQIANEIGVSRSRLYTCVKECLGCSVHALITVIKMQEAKRILKSGEALIKEVAIRLGYWSPYHFSTRFKLFFGISPKELREHYQQRRQDQGARIDAGNNTKNIMIVPEREQQVQNPSEEVLGPKSAKIEELPTGTAIDRFLIVNRIGKGGMGVVYRAYDPKLNRGVALKLIRADRAESTKSQIRLLREAQALARLSHPNVLHVYDVGMFGNQVFMTMALVEGLTLKEWLNAQKRSVEEIVGVMIAAGRGLSAAHKAGLIHRDFKPSNVIVGVDGLVRVLDFGLARSVSSVSRDKNSSVNDSAPNYNIELGEITSGDSSNYLLSSLTHTGHLLGTPLYMAPEQHLGLETDERTDQFGFCLVLYEALYRKRPFVARSLEDLKSEVIRKQVCVPETDADVPDWLWQIVKKGLSAKRENRYACMDALLDELSQDPMQERFQKRLARKRKLYLIALVVLTITLPIGMWYGLRYRTVKLCKTTEGEFDAVWDSSTKASVQKAFLSTKKPYALGTWNRVESNLGRYLTKWIQMRSDICEARLIRGTQSEELFDLRMSCLKSRKQEFKALIRVFTKADAGVVKKAVVASSSLTPIAVCGDEKTLRLPYPPPKTAEAKANVEHIREKLAEVEALTKTGRYREGLVLAKNLEREANVIAYQPVQAEVLCKLGWLFDRVGEYKAAESSLYEAVRAAGESRAPLLAAKAMTGLVWVVGYAQNRPNDGLLIGRDAKTMIALAGGDDALKADLLNNMGVVFWSTGEYAKARQYYREALVISEKILGHWHPDVARSYGNLAIVHYTQGEYKKALEYYREALATFEQALGPEHPDGASTLNNMGEVFREQGKYDKALEYYAKALVINQKALGSKHRFVAQSLYNMGELFQAKGKYDKALEYYAKALFINQRALGPEHSKVVSTLNNIGQVFQERAEYDKAVKCYRKSLAIGEKVFGPVHPKIVFALSGIGAVNIIQGSPMQALKPLERAVSICEEKSCDQDPYGRGLFDLAQALLATGGDTARAIKLAKRARRVFEKTPKAFKKELEKVTAWLQKHHTGLSSASH